jgi:hypothetical protein
MNEYEHVLLEMGKRLAELYRLAMRAELYLSNLSLQHWRLRNTSQAARAWERIKQEEEECQQ